MREGRTNRPRGPRTWLQMNPREVSIHCMTRQFSGWPQGEVNMRLQRVAIPNTVILAETRSTQRLWTDEWMNKINAPMHPWNEISFDIK